MLAIHPFISKYLAKLENAIETADCRKLITNSKSTRRSRTDQLFEKELRSLYGQVITP